MRQRLCCAARALVITLGALGFTVGVATADNDHAIIIPIPGTATTGTGSTSIGGAKAETDHEKAVIGHEKAGTGHKIFIPGTAKMSTSTSRLFAPLWVYPSMPAVESLPVAPPLGGSSLLIIREEPSLLTPADLHFSVDTENGVTVVRGPRAR
jgi:hypothetical protein